MSAQGDEPVPLGGEARGVLDAARAAERLSPRRKAQMRARVMATVAVSAAAASVGAGAATAGAAGAETAAITGAAGVAKVAGLSLLAKIGLAVALTTIGAGGFLWTRANQTSPPASSAKVAAAPLVEPDADPETEPVTAVASAAAPEVTASAGGFPADPVAASTALDPAAGVAAPSTAPGAPKPATSAEPSVVASAEPVSADSLSEETKLLAAAHAELSRGNAAAALALLDQHAAKFPSGALAPERRAARAMALCKLGRSGDGQSEANALYGEGSKSPLADKIRRACAK